MNTNYECNLKTWTFLPTIVYSTEDDEYLLVFAFGPFTFTIEFFE